MKKLSYLFAVAASAACLCACTNVTDVLPAEQIPADARSTLGADVVLQWNNEEQTIDGFGVAQAGWSDYLYAHRKRQEIMDVMFGQDGLRLSILRGEVFPHYDETTFNMDEDINLSLDDPFFDIDFNRDENREGGNLAASKIRNLECPNYEICLIDYGCGKFNRKIHIMEQYP